MYSPSDKPTPFAKYATILTDTNPIAVPPYHMSEEKRKNYDSQLINCLEMKQLECESPYVASVALVLKREPD